ncbi:MAG: hypothetical protein CMC96_01575 [Flavobacteriales bacterium]|nr:hypothetical protein [Flavobacteriales bacterium]|tara:strand:+ start:12539 stop:13348 length:810 start_codon:yes stop_codon:yes gene_type:complete
MKLIAIHSMPRSGSTWLGSIIDSSPVVSYKMQPLFSYRLKGFLSDKSTERKIKLFKSKLLEIEDDFMDQIEKKNRGIIPNFKKKDVKYIAYKETRYHYILDNLLGKDENTFLVGLIRNPLAHLNSWMMAPKEFRKELGWRFEEEWRYANKKNENKREEYYGYEKWKEVAYLFHNLELKYPNQVYLINYLDFMLNTIKSTEKLFAYLNLPLDKQTLDFIESSKSKNVDDPYGVYRYKIKDDDWKRNLPKHIVDYVYNDLKESILEQYLKS